MSKLLNSLRPAQGTTIPTRPTGTGGDMRDHLPEGHPARAASLPGSRPAPLTHAYRVSAPAPENTAQTSAMV